MSFLDEITPLKEAALQALEAADSLAKLDDVRVLYLGTNGQFTGLLKQMSGLAKEERPAIGKAVNLAKAELTQTLDRRRKELELAVATPQRATDFTAPGRRRPLGKQHPLTQVIEDIVRSFRKIGFAVADGPEIDDIRVDLAGSKVERSTLRLILTHAIEQLPERDQQVLGLYYFHDMKLREIGDILGVTEARVCQLHKAAVKKLRALLADEGAVA